LFNLTPQAITDAQVHDVISTERGIDVQGKSSEQKSYEATNHGVSAVYRGEGTKSTNEDNRQQEQVQATSQDWESPVFVQGGLVHVSSRIIEQVGTCTLHACTHNDAVCLYKGN
jgi:hypothetical protein